MPNVTFTNQHTPRGWECPVCGAGNAPWMPTCGKCTPRGGAVPAKVTPPPFDPNQTPAEKPVYAPLGVTKTVTYRAPNIDHLTLVN